MSLLSPRLPRFSAFRGHRRAYHQHVGGLHVRSGRRSSSSILITRETSLSSSSLMSRTQLPASSSSNFQQIFDNALKSYQRRTKKDLHVHPLAAQLQTCDSPSSILAVLQQQVQDPNRSQSVDDRLTKWLDPTVNVLCSLSDALGEGVSLVCPRT